MLYLIVSAVCAGLAAGVLHYTENALYDDLKESVGLGVGIFLIACTVILAVAGLVSVIVK